MCELFGISSGKKIICNDMLKKFYSQSVDHPDGWGLATFYKNAVSVEKEPLPAFMSQYLASRLTDEIEEDVLMAHIRKASVGALEYKNSHPFFQRDESERMWTLCHNGTIFESRIVDAFRDKQKGNCDSERVLLYFLDCINEETIKQGHVLEAKERFDVIDKAIHLIVPRNKVNLMLYDGELLYVHMNHPNSLHSASIEDGFVFSTAALDEEHQWYCVPLNTLLAFRKGRLVYTGKTHEFTYLKENETENIFDSQTSVDIYYL